MKVDAWEQVKLGDLNMGDRFFCMDHHTKYAESSPHLMMTKAPDIAARFDPEILVMAPVPRVNSQAWKQHELVEKIMASEEDAAVVYDFFESLEKAKQCGHFFVLPQTQEGPIITISYSGPLREQLDSVVQQLQQQEEKKDE